MKKLKGFLFILLVLSLILSCNNDSVTWGKIEITLTNEVTRGIAAADMSTDNYDVTILNSSGDTVASSNIKASDISAPLTFSVPSGTYTVKVDARNKDSEVIGRGESNITVVADSTANCQITVQEITGNGTLSVQIDSDTPNIPVLKIYKADLSLLDTVTTTGSDGIFVSTKSLSNGFYYFEILDDDEVIDSETIRIVANKTISYNIEYSVYGNSSITIIDNIDPTPSISFELASNVSYDSSVSITPTITGFTPTTYLWYLDGAKIAETKDLSLEASDYILGEHSLTLIASDGTIIWSEEKYFSIVENPLADHYVAHTLTSQARYFFFDFINGSLYFSNANGQDFDMGPLDYNLISSSDGTFLVFNAYEIYGVKDYALFIPADEENYATGAKMYYSCTLTDDLELIYDEQQSQSLNLIVTDAPVAYDEAYDRYDETYHTIARVTEYGTFLTSEKVEHEYGEEGICTACGFNPNNNEYALSNNIDNVADSGTLYISRYWTGITTLGDGTVIEDEDCFCIRKEPRFDNYYTLYYPSSIYDAYEEGGGIYSSTEAFIWYVKEYYGLDCNYNYDSGLRSILETLWTEGVKEASSADYSESQGKKTVYSDTSLITDDIPFDGIGFYNTNTIQNEDETPITDYDRFYFSLFTNMNGETTFCIECPQSLQDEFEKAQLFNSNSGDPMWKYLKTYYPDDPRTTAEEKKALMIKLLESEFIEPNYEDYL